MSSSTTDIRVSAGVPLILFLHSVFMALLYVFSAIITHRPSRIPVLYVFSKAQLDINHAAQSLLNVAIQKRSISKDPPHFILIPDVAYAHLTG